MVLVNKIGSDGAEQLIKMFKPNCLIVITHPRCGHCRAIKPALDELYDDLEKNYHGDVEVFDVHGDALENAKYSIPDLENVRGYPTILASRENKQPEEYNGDRSKEDIIRFMMDNFVLKPTSGRRKSRKFKKSRKNRKMYKKSIKKGGASSWEKQKENLIRQLQKLDELLNRVQHENKELQKVNKELQERIALLESIPRLQLDALTAQSSIPFGGPSPIPFDGPSSTPFSGPSPTPFDEPSSSPFGAPSSGQLGGKSKKSKKSKKSRKSRKNRKKKGGIMPLEPSNADAFEQHPLDEVSLYEEPFNQQLTDISCEEQLERLRNENRELITQNEIMLADAISSLRNSG